MIKVSHAKLRNDGKWVVAIDPNLVPRGVDRGSYDNAASFLRNTTGSTEWGDGPEAVPSGHLCWVQLQDLVSTPVLHVEEKDEVFYAVVATKDVPANMWRGPNNKDLATLLEKADFATDMCYERGPGDVYRPGNAYGEYPCFVFLGDLPMKPSPEARQDARPSDFGDRLQPKAGPDTIDGLTRAECLARYESWMRDEYVNGVRNRTREGGNRALTPAQLVVAKDEWSAQIKAKRLAAEAEAKRKEYESLAVDDDRWEVE